MAIDFKIGELDHVVLRVRSVERSVAFYRDVLGINEERRLNSIGLVQLRAGASLIDLVPADPDAQFAERNMEHFALTVTPFDADALALHLRTHGVEPGKVGQRYGAKGTGPSIYFDDPDGNTVELKGPPD
jgi:glyoxylase I family protein